MLPLFAHTVKVKAGLGQNTVNATFVDANVTYTIVSSCEFDSSEDGTSNESNACEKHADVEYTPVVDGCFAEDFGQGCAVVLTTNMPLLRVELSSIEREQESLAAGGRIHTS